MLIKGASGVIWYSMCRTKQSTTKPYTYFMGYRPTVYRTTLQWRHSERDSVSNHWHLNCLNRRLFRRRSKKTSKLRVNLGPVASPHKGPITRKTLFSLGNIIMNYVRAEIYKAPFKQVIMHQLGPDWYRTEVPAQVQFCHITACL